MGRKILLWVMVAGIIIFLNGSLHVAASGPVGKSSFTACDSFGILRFPDKKVAPAFSLKTLDGNTVALNDLKGKPTILFFWGSWCEACKEDIALLQKFMETRRGQLNVLTIAVDGEREKRIQRIVKDHKITLPILLVFKENVIKQYSINAIPVTYLISEEGLIVGKILGQRDWSTSEAWSALKEVFNLN